jgi:hypothetical protein
VDHRLLSFDTALSIVLSEIIENDFLDPPSKKSIIDLIESSRLSKSAWGTMENGGQINGSSHHDGKHPKAPAP